MKKLTIKSNDMIKKIKMAEKEYSAILSLSANENIMSETARKYLSSSFSNRYFFQSKKDDLFSDFPEFIASSSSSIKQVLLMTEIELKRMFNAQYINLSPLSGINAMLMVILSLTDPGDNIASLDPSQNGHFITKQLTERIARNTITMPSIEGEIDIKNLAKFVKENSIKMIYLDGMSYTKKFDIAAIRKCVGGKVIIVLDASHVLGLIAGNKFQKPFDEGADIICGNTHKTFPGPHRGIIIAKSNRYSSLIKKHEGKLYSSNHLNSLMSLAITTFEMSEYGNEYAKKIVDNANRLRLYLNENKVGKIIPNTDNHQVHIIYSTRNQAFEMFEKLYEQGISTHVCYTKSEGYFVRIGTQEITRYGMDDIEMKAIADIIYKIELGNDMRKQISKLVKKFGKVHYSFDNRV